MTPQLFVSGRNLTEQERDPHPAIGTTDVHVWRKADIIGKIPHLANEGTDPSTCVGS